MKAFFMFKTKAELTTGKKIKAIQTVGGRKYDSLMKFLKFHGIGRQMSYPYTAQQNYLAKQRHRQIVEMGLSMLAQSSMTLSY